MELEKNKWLLVGLFAFSLVVYLWAVLSLEKYWFVGDEGFYALSIYEAAKSGIKPYITYYGTPVFWKPFLMIDLYALAAAPLASLLPYTTAYRIPSAILSAADVVLVYVIASALLKDNKKALIAALIFGLNPLSLLYGTKVFNEPLTLFFVLGTALSSIKMCGGAHNRLLWLALAAVCILGAAFAKSATMGIACAGICVAYAFISNREALPYAVGASLAAIGIILLFPFLTEFPDAFYKQYLEDFFTRRMNTFRTDNVAAAAAVFIYIIPIIMVGYKSFSLKDRSHLFLALWALPVLAVMVTTPYAWYLLYFLPPIAMLAAALSADTKIDRIAIYALIVIGVIGYLLIGTELYDEELRMVDYIAKNIGKNECTLFVGAMLPTIHSYLEMNGYAHSTAFTYVREYTPDGIFLKANLTQEEMDTLVHSYESADFIKPISSFRYIMLPWQGIDYSQRFRTDKGCSSFKKVIITDADKMYALDGYRLSYEKNQFVVWERAGHNES
ncbi:MAG: hypothetical protein QXU54_02090 [Candidatus Micrarchaeia archaeon]